MIFVVLAHYFGVQVRIKGVGKVGAISAAAGLSNVQFVAVKSGRNVTIAAITY